MPEITRVAAPARRRRADAQRNEQTLLDAAAAAFVASGVDVPVRDIATRAGVGMGTVYRHFPTRADLVVAVYRHQVEACAEAGPRLLAQCDSPEAALRAWVGSFVELLVTKHGLAAALQGDSETPTALHTYFVDRLVPVADHLLDAVVHQGGGSKPVEGYALLRGIGNLCIGGEDAGYRAEDVAQLLVGGVLDAAAGGGTD